jgi:hypothetical protein
VSADADVHFRLPVAGVTESASGVAAFEIQKQMGIFGNGWANVTVQLTASAPAVNDPAWELLGEIMTPVPALHDTVGVTEEEVTIP